MSVYKKVGILVADDVEYFPLIEAAKQYCPKEEKHLGMLCHSFTLENGIQVLSVYTGIGKVAATAGATMLALKNCEAIFNFGFSGAISKVKKGELVLGAGFFEHDFDLTPIGYEPCQKRRNCDPVLKADEFLLSEFKKHFLGIFEGIFATGDCFVSNAALRDKLRDDYGAVACDMETAAVADVCKMAEIPFVCLRQISDDAGDSAADIYRETISVSDVSMSLATLKVLKGL